MKLNVQNARIYYTLTCRSFADGFFVERSENVAGEATSEARHESDRHDVRCELDPLCDVQLTQLRQSTKQRLRQACHVADCSVVSHADQVFLQDQQRRQMVLNLSFNIDKRGVPKMS